MELIGGNTIVVLEASKLFELGAHVGRHDLKVILVELRVENCVPLGTGQEPQSEDRDVEEELYIVSDPVKGVYYQFTFHRRGRVAVGLT